MIRAVGLGAAALALAGCGGGDEEPLTVFAATSLTEVFQELSPDARFNFAGSDELATQIREGAEADVYAAANARYPLALVEEGLAAEPVRFATNQLALIVPAANPAGIRSVDDLDREGVRLVIGAEGVPVGDYTRRLLERTGLRRVLDRVVSNEEDVKGIVGKVVLGEADAGFVYVTDALAAGDDVVPVEIGPSAQPAVEYLVVVVRGTDQPDEAEEFVELLLSDRGRRVLREAGFGP